MLREAGILLAVSSLPSKEGIGTLGEGAYSFVEYLAKAGVKVWQVLPLTPTREGNSPYSSVCATALNPLFIDLFDLVSQGLLEESEVSFVPSKKVDYPSVIQTKGRLLRLAFSRFDKKDKQFLSFVKNGAYDDFAVFSTLSEAFGGAPFWEWEDGLDTYDKSKVNAFIKEHKDQYLYYLFTQYLFEQQWKKLKEHANSLGVKIFGDMPIYVAMNSAEVYFHPELFLFDERRRPTKVAGVPPDYFNSEGQLWGNPLYDWERMKKDGYRWWRGRIERELAHFDVLRIDHFRGLDRFYAIDADATDAKHGVWMPGPGADLFDGITDLPIVAEDLGFVDDSLKKMLSAVGFPGMKVYEFGLNGDPWCEHKPANYNENVVAYTGTHDNMPFRGYLDSLSGAERCVAARDILIQATVLKAGIPSLLNFTQKVGAGLSEQDAIHQKVAYLESQPLERFASLPAEILTDVAFRTLLCSKARLAVVPMQDILALGASSRMNTPALVSEDNWAWRLSSSALTKPLLSRLQACLRTAKR